VRSSIVSSYCYLDKTPEKDIEMDEGIYSSLYMGLQFCFVQFQFSQLLQPTDAHFLTLVYS